MNLDRRAFIGGIGATFVVHGVLAAAKRMETPRLRVGIVSDVHAQHAFDPNDKKLQGYFSTGTLEKALTYFREQGVDAVVIAGDMTQFGGLCELEATGISWRRVFPGDRGLGGKHVEKLFICGNYESMGGLDKKKPSVRQDPKAAFRDALGIEGYEPIMCRKVNGYPFVLVNWGHERDAGKWIAEHAKELPKNKPFFYVQHPHLKGTNICATDKTGAATEALRKYPNAIAFSGHSHISLTWDHQIWQEEFTAVGTASLQYMWNFDGRDNSWLMRKNQVGHAPRLSTWGRQGMLMSVYDDRVVLERREFLTDKPIGPDWVITFDGKRPYRWEKCKAESVAPAFAKGAAVKVVRKEARNRNKEKEMQLQLVFPRPLPAKGDQGRTIEYEAKAFLAKGGDGKPLVVRRAFAEKYYCADECIPATGLVCFAESEFPAGEKIRFEVRALNGWEKRSAPIFGEVVIAQRD